MALPWSCLWAAAWFCPGALVLHYQGTTTGNPLVSTRETECQSIDENGEDRVMTAIRNVAHRRCC